MRNIYLVTHAQSLHHVEKKVGGWYDTPLTKTGQIQAEKTALLLKSKIKTSDYGIYSSDLKRAKETAEIIGKHLQKTVTLDPRLREMNFGEAGGKPLEWSQQWIKPQPVDGNRLNHRIYKGAENRIEIAERITEALNQILIQNLEDTIIVTHGFASTFLIMAWMKIPPEHMDYCDFPAKPSSLTLLHEDDLFNNRGVEYLCSTTHLKDNKP
jgi:probable phosphoglycerate mutase